MRIKKTKNEVRTTFFQKSVYAEYAVGNDKAIVYVEKFLLFPIEITVMINDENHNGLAKVLKVLQELELTNFKIIKKFNKERRIFYKGVIFKEYYHPHSVKVWLDAIEDCLQNFIDEEGESK